MNEKNYIQARKYHELGLSIIPIAENNKLPLVAWQDFTKTKADESQITEWFALNPEKNVGIITGAISGITVVDFDVKNGLSPRFSDFPPTKMVKTPSGGYHLYYKYNPNIRTGVDVFRDNTGVDIRNDGGYVVAPPSVINGSSYETIDKRDFAVLDEFIFGNITHQKKQATTLVGLQEGGRNQAMASLIGSFLKVTAQDKWDTDLWTQVQLVNNANRPPLPMEELETTFNSIKNRELLSISAKSDGQSNEVREFLSTIDVKDLENIEDAATKNAFLSGLAQYRGDDEIISSMDIVEQIKKEGAVEKFYSGWGVLDSIIGGFTPGQLIVISAPTKNGKTSWSMGMTSLMSQYSPTWFPFEESAHELVGKFVERGLQPPLFFVPKALTDNKLEWIEMRIIESLVKNKSRVFFIDQLDWLTNEKKFLGQEINNIMKGLKRIAKTWNVVILVMAHITKLDPMTAPTMNDLRDSGNIANKCDTLIMLWRYIKRGKDGLEISNNLTVSVQLNRRTGKTGVVKFTCRDGVFLEDDWTIETIQAADDKNWNPLQHP